MSLITGIPCIVLVLFLLLSWPLAPASRAADRLTMSSTHPTAFEWDVLVARAEGFFARENLEVEITYLPPQLVVTPLIAGQVHVAKSGTHFGLIATTRGAELRIVAGGLYGYPYDLISRPDIRSLTDLRGQQIAGAALSSILTVVFKEIMARHGIPASDYTLIFVGGSPERYQALKSGQVAASYAEAPPFNFQAVDSGHRVLFRYTDLIKELQYTSYFASPKFAAANRPLMLRFVRAIAHAQQWLNDPANERRAVQILGEHLRIDQGIAARSYRYLIAENKAFRGEGKIDGPGLAEMIRLLAEGRLMPKREPWESFVDVSFRSEIKTPGER